jgi:hypothetical protein
MRLRHLWPICVLVMYVNFSMTESISATPSCDKVSIPLHQDSPSKYFEVIGSWISTDANGALEGEISVHNLSDKSLSFLTVIVNYLDEKGSIMFSLPYQANLPSEENHLRNVRPFSELRLNEPVGPGEAVGLTGRSLLSIAIVPSSAEVVYWQAKFYEDGSSVSTSFGQHGFRTDPVLVETPGYLRVPLRPPAEPVETLLKLRINEYGRVLDVQRGREGDTHLTQEQFETLTQQIAKWHFFPAVESGYGVPSDLFLLVQFEPENSIPIKRCSLEQPDKSVTKFALATLQALRNFSDRWTLNYGGFPAIGKLETNIIRVSPPTRVLNQ